MLRKLIIFAITSGLAKKAYDHYRASRNLPVPVQKASLRPVPRRVRPVSVPPNV